MKRSKFKLPSLVAEDKELTTILSKLVAQAWIDEEFKKRLLSNPAAVLEENGVTISDDVQVSVNENAVIENDKIVAPCSGDLRHYEILLPSKPARHTDEQIQSWLDGYNPDSLVPALTCRGGCA